MLSNTERLRRTGDMIEESYQITIESERVGMTVMDDLQQDREKIQRTQRRVRCIHRNGLYENCVTLVFLGPVGRGNGAFDPLQIPQILKYIGFQVCNTM